MPDQVDMDSKPQATKAARREDPDPLCLHMQWDPYPYPTVLPHLQTNTKALWHAMCNSVECYSRPECMHSKAELRNGLMNLYLFVLHIYQITEFTSDRIQRSFRFDRRASLGENNQILCILHRHAAVQCATLSTDLVHVDVQLQLLPWLSISVDGVKCRINNQIVMHVDPQQRRLLGGSFQIRREWQSKDKEPLFSPYFEGKTFLGPAFAHTEKYNLMCRALPQCCTALHILIASYLNVWGSLDVTLDRNQIPFDYPFV
jgi:hypothetical protein